MDRKRSSLLLESLSNAFGCSGFEEEVAAIVEKRSESFAHVSKDAFHSLCLRLKSNTGGKPALLLDAHSDEIGFMAQGFLPNGMISFLPVGSWSVSIVPAQKVRIRNADGGYVGGVITSKPIHFMTKEEESERPAFDKLAIDVGASSKKELEEVFILRIGAPIVPDVRLEMATDDVVLGKALDCRIGCLALLEALEALNGKDLAVDVVGVVSAQEEIGGMGAAAVAGVVKADIVLAFEGAPADDTFASPWEAQGAMGKGVQLRHMDRSMVYSPALSQFALKLARSRGIPVQETVRRGGGTNAALYQLKNGGTPSIVLGIPVRYAHSHHCFASLSDCEAAVDLAIAIAESLTLEDVERMHGRA